MLYEEMREHLTKRLIPFWENLKDDEFGGFYGWMDAELVVDKKAVKGCILNSRIMWFFSNAYMCLGDENLKEYAEHAYRFLRDFCYDNKRGGVYWSVTYNGEVVDSTKHTYNQAFAVYALSSYYRAFGDEEAINLANKLVETIETKCFDEYGYKEALDMDFRPVANDKLSENGVLADRTMNTLLHVLEAYTEYYLVTNNSVAEDKLRWMLDLVTEHVYNPELHRQEVFFDNNMNSLIDLHSYGHDIEAAWLMDRALDVLKNTTYRQKLSPILRDLEKEVYRAAYSNHSLANECERGVVDTKRVWWVQAEAVVGFYNAYEKTFDPKYLQASEDIWEYIKKYLIDSRDNGEWFWFTDEAGNPTRTEPVVEPWKCPYHNGRMCIEMIRRGAGR